MNDARTFGGRETEECSRFCVKIGEIWEQNDEKREKRRTFNEKPLTSFAEIGILKM